MLPLGGSGACSRMYLTQDSGETSSLSNRGRLALSSIGNARALDVVNPRPVMKFLVAVMILLERGSGCSESPSSDCHATRTFSYPDSR